MLQTHIRSLSPRLLAAALLALAVAAPALAEERTTEKSFAASSLDAVELENLAGRVELVAASGSELRIEATVHGEASAGIGASEMLGTLGLDFDQSGRRLVVRALYPVDRFRRYHYPGSRSGADDSWLASWLGGSSSTVKYQKRDVKVVSSSASDAATLWADFRIEVPAGIDVKVKNSVGQITSDGVSGNQSLDTASGDIEVGSSAGSLLADTGSGDVTVTDHEGDVSVDTGSGDVSLVEVRAARLAVDTGSGDVSLVDCSGALDADTGSGTIRGRGLVLGDRLRADTGSGDIRLAGDFGAVRDLVIDTGSGDVVLDVSDAPSVRLRVSTGSGDIEVDLPDMHVRQWKGDFVADVGAAEGSAVVDTGSGDVRIVTSGG